MQTLTKSTGNFDQVNTFTVEVKVGKLPAVCSLQQDYQKVGDGIFWFMKHSACLKANYNDADIAERNRLSKSVAIKNGEVVLIDGKQYKVKVMGDYSDCAILEEI